jgi:hypothetical protein
MFQSDIDSQVPESLSTANPNSSTKDWQFQSVLPTRGRLAKKPIGVRFEEEVDEKLRQLGKLCPCLIREWVIQGMRRDKLLP